MKKLVYTAPMLNYSRLSAKTEALCDTLPFEGASGLDQYIEIPED